MTVINLDNFKKAPKTQIQFNGVTYNLVNNSELTELVQIARGAQAKILSSHAKQVSLVDKAENITTMAKYVKFANDHSDEMIKATKEIEKEAPAVYIDFFNKALLDENDQPCEAGEKIANFFDDSTLLASFFNQIADMVDNITDSANDSLSELTKSAYEKAQEDE